jgi:trans-2,3-dihydro-3-hydroxyanthranilate isomerase
VIELPASNVAVHVDPGNGDRGGAWMEQPVPRFRATRSEASTVAGMLGLDGGDVAPGLPLEYGSAGVEYLLVPLRSLDAVGRARPDPLAFPRFFAGADHAAAYVFATETVAADAAAHARMFFVVLGSEVREDAATGSAAGPCGAYLVRHGRRPAGGLAIEQGIELGRPSRLEVEIAVRGDALDRVRVGGGVVRVTEGRLFLPETSAPAGAA